MNNMYHQSNRFGNYYNNTSNTQYKTLSQNNYSQNVSSNSRNQYPYTQNFNNLSSRTNVLSTGEKKLSSQSHGYNSQYQYQQNLKNQQQIPSNRISNISSGFNYSGSVRIRNVQNSNTEDIEKRQIQIKNQQNQNLSQLQKQLQNQQLQEQYQKEEQKQNFERQERELQKQQLSNTLNMKNINSPPIKKSKTNMGITGLTNIGNTCFMNSALQCLFNLPEFNDYFLQDKYVKDLRSNNKGIAKQYAKLLKNIRGSGSSNSYYSRGENTHDLKRAIEKVAPIFSGYGQQDSQEFLRCLIDGLHEDLNRIVRKPPYRELQADLSKHDIKHISHDWFNYYKSIDDSVIQDFFRGQLSNKVTCNKCGYESLAFDNFLDISLSFSGRATLLHNVSLEQLIQVFLNKEDQIEEYYCSKCKKQRNCSRQFEFFKMPNILVFHLKRFKFGRSIYSSGSKINHYVSFPITSLNMSKYKQSSDDNSFDDAIYDLVGIVNHSGSLSGGHYTSECMNPYDHRWYRFNDSHVSEVNMDQTQYDTSGSPSPYILFYVKRNLHKN